MKLLKIGGGITAALAVLSMTVPAQAQDRRWQGRGDHKRHHRGGDRIDAGDLLIGAVLLGGILALTSGSKKRQRTEADYDAPYAPDADQYDGVYDPEAAGERCGAEAGIQGGDYARFSRLESVGSTNWNGRSWVVKGRVELSDDDDQRTVRTASFRCTLRAGSAPVVTFEGY
ncbi:hypothetical protein [Sphingomonas soli]|uniref:hypothetical protein n=1 Tax=Sphingomonas soli TaxID=266127 RepID=UPI000A82383B|nr:hypothetical protein [Sphingomonas soli]